MLFASVWSPVCRKILSDDCIWVVKTNLNCVKFFWQTTTNSKFRSVAEFEIGRTCVCAVQSRDCAVFMIVLSKIKVGHPKWNILQLFSTSKLFLFETNCSDLHDNKNVFKNMILMRFKQIFYSDIYNFQNNSHKWSRTKYFKKWLIKKCSKNEYAFHICSVSIYAIYICPWLN